MSIELSLEDKIAAAIKSSLPQEVGEVLKQRLNQAQATEAELNKTKAVLDTVRASNNELYDQVQTQKEIISKHLELTDRTAKVEQAERNLKVKELEFQLGAERRVSTAYDQILNALVRNPVYKETILSTVPIANQGYVQTHPGSETKTTTVE